jgi:2-keto-4-pentenoate hydratase/2-oxohepta-3-ene-1,7-dioic acid hydratase in catechol pathway
MKLLMFERTPGRAEPGVLDGDRVISLSGAGFSNLMEIFGSPDAQARVRDYASSAPADATVPMADVRILAPITQPEKILCIGLNYRDHAAESNMAIPEVPTVFSKFANCIIGPEDPIVLPKVAQKPDYEAEFAVVIGKGGRNIPESDWEDAVFGYMNLHDVSARDLQLATTQWLMGKSIDTFCPIGPYVVSKDEIADPHALDIQITVSGEVLQKSNTRELIFKLPKLISYISQVMTLKPGDIITTGTPAGVGLAHKPPRWLRPGDVCVVEVAGLGQLRNPVVLED